MKKQLIALTLLLAVTGSTTELQAQTNKNKKSRYYQNSTTEPDEFNVQGFATEPEKKEVDQKPVENQYDVKVKVDETEGKYKGEQRVIERASREERKSRLEREYEYAQQQAPIVEERRVRTQSYPTTYGGYRTYNENRNRYDKYYSGNVSAARPVMEQAPPPPVPAPPPAPRRMTRKDKEIKMTNKESEYQMTVVRKRYTNLDVLCDDLDLAKLQRPVFKGICTECSHDVDLIIVNKNLSTLEKNYRLKQCYMQRDKRLRETLDDDQYKKWLRIKDADEYLIITKDPELKDGIYK